MGLIKLLIDDRNGGGTICPRIGLNRRGPIILPNGNICDAFDKAGGADVIIADEAQFLLRNRWIRWARWWMNAICRCSASRRGRIFRSISLMARCLMELADFHRQSQNDLCLRAQGHRQRPHCPAGEQRCSGVQIRLGGNSYLAMCCNAGRRKNARQSDISSREK